jgi:Skp family chaperone for outer membrane proteins
MKLQYMGWIVAGAIVAVAATTGFSAQGTKVGVVDATKVFNESEFAKTQVDTLKQLAQARQDMLQFLDNYRTFTTEDANKFHDLSMKAPVTPADKAEIDKIKNAVITADGRLKTLQTKSNLTPAETNELNELSRRVQTTNDLGTRWSREAQDEFGGKKNELQKNGLDKVKEAIKQAASAEGYTIVFIADVAPYGANDLTASALKVMNKK